MSNQYQTQGYTVNDAGRRLIVGPDYPHRRAYALRSEH